MIKKPTWFFLAIFLVLLIITMVAGKTGHPVEGEITPTTKPAGKVVPAEIITNLHSLSYRDAHGKLLVLNKDNGIWSVLSGNTNVNQARIAELLANLESLEIVAHMDSTTKIDDLNINLSSQEIVLTASGGQNIRIRIGMLTPTGNGYYIQVKDDTPVVASKGGIETILNIFNLEILKDQSFTSP